MQKEPGLGLFRKCNHCILLTTKGSTRCTLSMLWSFKTNHWFILTYLIIIEYIYRQSSVKNSNLLSFGITRLRLPQKRLYILLTIAIIACFIDNLTRTLVRQSRTLHISSCLTVTAEFDYVKNRQRRKKWANFKFKTSNIK